MLGEQSGRALFGANDAKGNAPGNKALEPDG
jgi:hypothetical protein